MMTRKISASLLFDGVHDPQKEKVMIIQSDGTITDIADLSEFDNSIGDIEFLEGILCPGFVNTHCHLELSWLENTIPEKTGLDEFIRTITRLSRLPEPEFRKKIALAEKLMLSNGIIAVGDIMNTAFTFAVKANKRIWYHNFIEVFGADPDHADNAWNHWFPLYAVAKSSGLPTSITPHAPYSVSVPLFRKLKEQTLADNNTLSIHMMENEDENEYFKNGTGKLTNRYRSWGITRTSFSIPSGKRSLQTISDLLPTFNRTLFVHNTVMTPEDILFISDHFEDPWWCFCPQANLYIENRLPDIPIFREFTHRITLGTDSLASNHNLSILEEIKSIAEHYPDIPLRELIQWGTLNGAEFLRISEWAGSLTKGKRPGINLIELVDLKNLTLTPESRVRVITSYHP